MYGERIKKIMDVKGIGNKELSEREQEKKIFLKNQIFH